MSNYEENERQALKLANASRIREQLRKNENVNGKKVVSTKKNMNKVLMSIGIVGLSATLLFILSCSKSQAKLKGSIIDPRTGYIYNSNKNPSFDEILNEMFNRKNGK